MSVSMVAGSDYVLKESDVPHLVTCMTSISDKWEELGISLHLPGNTREQCRSSKNILSLGQILTEWVAGRGLKPATLGQLVKALASDIVGRGRLAGTLISEFNKGLTEVSQPSYPASSQVYEPKASSGTNVIVDMDQLKALRPKLKLAMKFDVKWLATEMNTAGILSDDNHETISAVKTMHGPADKVELMVSDFMDKVELDSENLTKVVDIMKRKSKGYQEAIRFLEDKTLWKENDKS